MYHIKQMPPLKNLGQIPIRSKKVYEIFVARGAPRQFGFCLLPDRRDLI